MNRALLQRRMTPKESKLIFEKHSRIVFVGDSITDADRDRTAIPGGWGYGHGYGNTLHNLLTAVYPDKALCTINEGINGNDIVDMSERWQSDVIDMNPDYVSIMIGVNDAWRYFDGPLWQARLNTVETYERIYDELIERVKQDAPNLKGIIVMRPFMFEPNPQDAMRAKVEEFAAASKRVAERHGAIFVDTQAAVDHWLTQLHGCLASQDRVHPYERGAMIIARAWCQAVGFDWNRTTFDD